MTETVSSRIEVQPGVFLSVSVRGERARPALIFSNSLAASQCMWDSVIDVLGERLCLITYDTRGHGRSDMSAAPCTLARLGEDVVAILDALHISRVYFCGLSLGGLTGMWLGVNRPERLSGLVLANTAANFPPASMWSERARAARSEGLGSLVEGTLERWFTAGFRKSSPDYIESARSMIADTSPDGYAACCRVLGEADMTGSLASIHCPVLVLAGRVDASTPPEKGRAVLEGIGHGSFTELDAAHLSAIERPREFAEATRRFLDCPVGP